MSETKKKIVIVGGGIAGLSAGIYGKLAGYDVDIYEKNPIAGGQCMGWNRKGCHIDNCIHWLTGTKKGTTLREVWETVGALDEHTEFADCDSFYTSIKGDFQVTLWKDLERTRAELLRLSPEDAGEIEKFIEHVKYAAECEMPAEKPMDAFGVKDYIRMGASMADEGIRSHRSGGTVRAVQAPCIKTTVYRLSAKRICRKLISRFICQYRIRQWRDSNGRFPGDGKPYGEAVFRVGREAALQCASFADSDRE